MRIPLSRELTTMRASTETTFQPHSHLHGGQERTKQLTLVAQMKGSKLVWYRINQE